ncbi:retrovirus-related Pol polyprotein from transposon 297 [Trichonephila clavipes]|nr:retrovirus-related Pol polyprotein from transposon 297 [Trichonephila clavipes]
MKLSMTATSTNISAAAAERINIQHLIPRFVENSDISIYLKIFERQLQKLDDYEVARGKTSNHKVLPDVRTTSFHSKANKQIRTVDKAKEREREPRKSFRGHSQFESRNPLSCYGCGKTGYIKSKCPDCNPSKGDPAHFGILRINSLSPSNRSAVLRISINGVSGTAFVDSGASHSIAGETLYTILLQQGAAFEKTVISLSFADGIVTQKEALRTFQTVILEATRGLLATDHVILNHGQVTWTTPELAPPLLTTTPHQREDVSALDRFNVHRCPTRRSTSVNVRPVAINNCQLREDEGQELLGSLCAELDSLLRNHPSIFEVGGEATPFIEHSINTENNPPISVPPYRMNPARKELLKKELDSLLQQGIIVECESPYASPVVLIPKPNGSIRLRIDYRKLNTQTVPDSYHLLRMDDLLNEAKPTPYMSTIDLRSGYHQVKVAAEDQDKTAFTCPFGIYKFTRMPFGLRNAPATFQRLIDKFRSGLNNVLALPYLDDIIILSPTFQKHLSDLEQVFKRLSLFKLNANREKCNFCCKKVKYLGHYITKEGISVDPQKTAAIADMSSPTSVKQVQSFVQTCSWYRRYIPNFSQIAKPLTDLTKKNAMWKWGSEQEEAFRDLKLKLASPPVLEPADGTKLFVIRTDASSVALGAVLLQGEKDEEHPIEYASRLLSSSSEIILQQKEKLLQLPTSEQEKADCDILAVFVDFPTRSPKEVRQEQLKDDELKKIIECFENNEKSVTFPNWLERGYLMNQGILFRYSPTSESEEAQLVVPIHERQDILKIHHDAPNVGHYGADGTFERISKRYYWTGMRSYIADYVKNCTECNRYKPYNQKPSGLLRTPVYSQRFETISIDIFGPLPESPSGKK